MAFQHIQIRSREFQPAAVGTDETTALFSIKKGERVMWASALSIIAAAASTQSTYTLGDGDDPDGLIAAIDTETFTAGTLIDGAGAYLAESGGKLYLADDTVDVVYDQTTPGATNPKVKFTIAVAREWPS